VSEAQELPHGWDWATLGEIGRWSGGGTPSKANEKYWTGGSHPWVSPKDMKVFRIHDSEDHITDTAIAETVAKLVPVATILIVVRSGILERLLPVAITQTPVTMNQDLKGITPYDGIDPTYVAYFLAGAERGIRSTCAKDGTTVASIDTESLKAYRIPIAPLAEQRRIVAAIEEQFTRLDAGVAALKSARARLKQYRAAVLKAAVEGELTKAWREAHPDTEPASELLARILAERRARLQVMTKPSKADTIKRFYLEPAAPRANDLAELPTGWQWCKVEQLSNLITSGSRGWASYYSDRGPLFIRAQDINTDELRLDSVAHVSLPATSEGTRTRVHQYDLLVTITGANVTKSALVREAMLEAYVSQHVGLVRPTVDDIAPYLYLWIITPSHGRKLLEEVAYGAGKPGLNLDNLRDLLIALPPLSEQERIVAEVERRLSVISTLEASVRAGLQRADRLRQSILREAFSGRLSGRKIVHIE